MIWVIIIWAVLWMCHAADVERKLEQLRDEVRRMSRGS